MEGNEFLTVKEAADYLRVTPASVYTWLGDGSLKGYKAGDQWRIKRSDLEAFMKVNVPE